jgi:phosphoglycolate phosphatase
MKLVLFDIDGTLLYCGKAGRRSLDKAIRTIFKSEGLPQNYSLAGKTDRQIIFEVLTAENYDKSEITEKLEDIFDEYFNILYSTLKNEVLDKKIMPGILPLLDNISALESDALLGLITGNLRKTAYLKLNEFGLQKYFMKNDELFGGFGSDHIDRSKVLEFAIQRANDLTNLNFKEKDIVVIGDTQNDILCGRHLNVKSIAVATGEWKYEELLKYEPDHLFEDFSDYEPVLKKIME